MLQLPPLTLASIGTSYGAIDPAQRRYRRQPCRRRAQAVRADLAAAGLRAAHRSPGAEKATAPLRRSPSARPFRNGRVPQRSASPRAPGTTAHRAARPRLGGGGNHAGRPSTNVFEAVQLRSMRDLGIAPVPQAFRDIVARNGWGWTGDSQANRTACRVIYQTSILPATPPAAGAQLNDPTSSRRQLLALRAADGVASPRPQRLAPGPGRLRYDHPWWQTHYPLNGFSYHCYVIAVATRGRRRHRAAAVGSEHRKAPAPAGGGISKGWGSRPGATATDPRPRRVVADRAAACAFQRSPPASLAEIKRGVRPGLWAQIEPAGALKRNRIKRRWPSALPARDTAEAAGLRRRRPPFCGRGERHGAAPSPAGQLTRPRATRTDWRLPNLAKPSPPPWAAPSFPCGTCSGVGQLESRESNG